MLYYRKHIKFIAVFLCLNMFVHMLMPTASLALTSGPSQPEFSSFEPVATTNMVNTFTGDFTYNIPLIDVPGPHGSGYPISLSYHSGLSTEEEASWVGYGWTLNAGAINRNTRGFPDDYKNKPIKYYNKMPANWTATLGGNVSGEIFGFDKYVNSNLSASIRYNNYKGFGYNLGAGVQLGKGTVNLGYNLDNGESSFNLGVNPYALATEYAKKETLLRYAKESYYKTDENAKEARAVYSALNKSKADVLSASSYGIFSFGGGQIPNIAPGYTGQSYNISVGLETNPVSVPAGLSFNLFGSYTTQENDTLTEVSSMGYMYSADAADENAMDYVVDKETNFSKRDVFLGVPINNADVFATSGEGIGGGFRLYHHTNGVFGPRKMESNMDIINLSPEVQVGPALGGGSDIGVGNQSLKVRDWNRSDQFSSLDLSLTDEPIFFRFNNDLGGTWGSNITDQAQQASPRTGSVANLSANPGAGERSGRSSYIGYNTNAEIKKTSNNVHYKAYSKSSELTSSELRSDDEAIGEFSIVNETGMRYTYGLPVRSKNEGSLSYGVRGVSSNDVTDNYIVNGFNEEVKLGTSKADPYATAYLLTEINGIDYLDVTGDGPTVDDFGGYTRFNYEAQYDEDNWYKWRMPYKGLYYQRNELSDRRDDFGSVSYGEKEVRYLKSIETKSHIAIFSLESRTGDAFGAAKNEKDAMRGAASSAQQLKKLRSISLYSRKALKSQDRTAPYSKGDFNGEPIKEVVLDFEGDDGDFSNELMKNAPNNAIGRGKLTLKSVKFIYNGVARISPYYFDYKYPEVDYPTPYDGFENFGNTLEDPVDDLGTPMFDLENPNYNPHNGNAWGHYQVAGNIQYGDFKTWLDQSQVPNKTYDPAAWHLKAITLPSGGQIHIQYEQDDYAYVQNQEAHVMVPLHHTEIDGQKNAFRIDHEATGLTSADDLKAMIQERYQNTDKKIYYKFLYKLKGEGSPDINKCNVEYISGYADVKNVSIENNYVKVELESANQTKLPGKICREYVRANRLGMLDNDDCGVTGLNDSQTNPEDVVLQLANFLTANLTPNILCKSIDPGLSYLRVPTPNPKIGGGVRVKRLLTFDNTLAEDVLYGTEYIYKTLNKKGRIISSGVATSEPQSMREENILVDYIAREGQTVLNKMIYGRDKETSEGPIGERLYPAPSVGYSKVIASNIHRGKTAPGYSVQEYHTAKDFPVKTKMTPLDDSRQRYEMRFTGLKNKLVNHQYATQGFSFILNNMHGQIKRQATFPGVFEDPLSNSDDVMSSEQFHFYYEPEDRVPVVDELFGAVSMKNPGREVDITQAQKSVIETTDDINVEFDGTIGIYPFFVIPFLTLWPFQADVDGELHTHGTTKVIRYPAIERGVRVYQDGIYHTTEHLAFNEETGKPVVTKTYDEHVGAYVTQSIPASWKYSEMGQISVNERLKVNDVTLSVETVGSQVYLQLPVGQSCEVLDVLREGDLLEFSDHQLYHIFKLELAFDRIILVKSSMSESSLVDGPVNSFEVVRSGNHNRLSEGIGKIGFHHEDERQLNLASLTYTDEAKWLYE
ncbi:MAG: hypothetical protein AAFQ94_21295, partial [Bacteroidota bacterium]